MPWKVSSEMEERLRFVARLLEGEPISNVARGRKTDSGCEGAWAPWNASVSADVIRKTAAWPWVSG